MQNEMDQNIQAAACVNGGANVQQGEEDVNAAITNGAPYSDGSQNIVDRSTPNNFGYILYYRNELWDSVWMRSVHAQEIQQKADKLCVEQPQPQRQWPGRWTPPEQPMQTRPPISMVNYYLRGPPPGQTRIFPLRDWAVVEILGTSVPESIEITDLRGRPRTVTPRFEYHSKPPWWRTSDGGDPNPPAGTGHLTYQIVKVVDVSRCVDSRSPGGNWDPGINPLKFTSIVGSIFACPDIFIKGHLQTKEQAQAAMIAEFQRQRNVYRFWNQQIPGIMGVGGVDMAQLAAFLVATTTMEVGSRMFGKIKDDKGQEDVVCPLIDDPLFNVCDIYSTPQQAQTMKELIQQACAEAVFDDDGNVSGTCSPMCKDVMTKWWDGGDRDDSSNCSCEFKRVYSEVMQSGTDDEKKQMIRSLVGKDHYNNLLELCASQHPSDQDTNAACAYEEPPEKPSWNVISYCTGVNDDDTDLNRWFDNGGLERGGRTIPRGSEVLRNRDLSMDRDKALLKQLYCGELAMVLPEQIGEMRISCSSVGSNSQYCNSLVTKSYNEAGDVVYDHCDWNSETKQCEEPNSSGNIRGNLVHASDITTACGDAPTTSNRIGVANCSDLTSDHICSDYYSTTSGLKCCKDPSDSGACFGDSSNTCGETTPTDFSAYECILRSNIRPELPCSSMGPNSCLMNYNRCTWSTDYNNLNGECTDGTDQRFNPPAPSPPPPSALPPDTPSYTYSSRTFIDDCDDIGHLSFGGGGKQANCESAAMRSGDTYYKCSWDPATSWYELGDCDRGDTVSNVTPLPVGEISSATQPSDGSNYLWYQNLPANKTAIVNNCTDGCIQNAISREVMGCDCDSRIDKYGNNCYTEMVPMDAQSNPYGGANQLYYCRTSNLPSWEDDHDSNRIGVLNIRT
jgi:hypothetical protein